MSNLSTLATELWSHLESVIPDSSKSEAAQTIVDLFTEAGCEDIYECANLVDASKSSILDDESALQDFEDECRDIDTSMDNYDCYDGGKEAY